MKQRKQLALRLKAVFSTRPRKQQTGGSEVVERHVEQNRAVPPTQITEHQIEQYEALDTSINTPKTSAFAVKEPQLIESETTEVASTAKFPYEQLSAGYIRLVKLDIPNPDDTSLLSETKLEITASFETISILEKNHVPTYIALSYAWGDPKLTRSIILNGSPFSVTRSLYDFLLHYSKPGQKNTNLPLWVDSICINQADLSERASQVKLMGSIYSLASSVKIWLGEASEDSDLAMDFVEELRIFLLRPPWRAYESSRLWDKPSTTPGSPNWTALKHLMERSWFSRIWVVQEVALAKSAEVMCGEKTLTWETFSGAIEEADQEELGGLMLSGEEEKDTLTTSIIPRGWGCVRNIIGARNTVLKKKLLTMAETADIFIPHQSTDPRDKIFALLGIVSDATDSAWEPDYSIPVHDLYTAVTHRFMEKGRPNWWKSAGLSHPRNIEELPSWVPDLSARVGASPLRGHSAGGKGPCEFTMFRERECIRFEGYVLAEIMELGPVHKTIGKESFKETSGIPFHTNHYEWYTATSALFSTPTNTTAFFHTLCASTFLTPESQYSSPYPTNSYFSTCYASYQHIFSLEAANPGEKRLFPGDLINEAQTFRNPMVVASLERRMCRLSGGGLGLVPGASKVGDQLCISEGVDAPLVIRKTGKRLAGVGGSIGPETSWFVGECFMYGLKTFEEIDAMGGILKQYVYLV